MSVLSGKKILLGISGGIAAYKTAHLVRLLIKAGAQVQVVMSPASLHFVTP
jgi:phosphopantothenoylcysteine decarboxylase/phosphopantothenate--cysteine ligase